ncbi:hypothetical protein ACFX2J_013313 [Malus domestica]
MLANGCYADSTDEYCRLAESTAIENLKHFCQVIQAIYGATYLRKPNCEDLKRLLQFQYKVNGDRYELGYYLIDDEYSKIEEDSDEDVDDDQPTHARAIVRDVEYLAPTTYETQQDRVTLSEYMRPLNRIQAPQGHDTLCKDLVEHVWHREGEH